MIDNRQIQNRPAARGWRERWMRRFGMDVSIPAQRGMLTVPNWLIGKSIVFYFVAMFACWMAFGYIPNFELWIVACISIVLFFYGGKSMSRSWDHKNEKTFLRNIFIVGLVLRLLWAFYGYFFFNMDHFGYLHGDDADTGWFMDYGKDLTKWLSGEDQSSFNDIRLRNASAIDDVAYPLWLGLIYLIIGPENDVAVPFILKCFMGAYCAVCVYYVAKRHFGEGAARMAAIFVVVNPNMIYWCGTMMKEPEMVFLVCIAIDSFDKVLTSGKRFTFKNLLPGMLAATALMFFRSALGLVIFWAVFAHIVMASQRVMSIGKKILAGLLVTTVLAVSMGDRIRTQSQELLNTAQSESQKANMEWRGTRKGGNSFAKYAGAVVFAPLIFTIPFPTFNQAQEGQLLQIQLSGGAYIKNILSFFVIIVMLMLLISGEWRRHVFIIAYTMGYLMVLVMSPFAQSGRFHMPVWPMLMLFAAYGIQIAKTNARVRRWFPIVLVIEVVACLAWNWFKLKGRGMI